VSKPDLPALEETPEKRALQAYNAAVRLLGSRDHSVSELSRKLRQREHGDEAIQSAIEELQELNYVNDRRYAQRFVEQRLAKGRGPLLIRSKLIERGVDQSLIKAAFAEQTECWSHFARLALEKRFTSEVIISRDKPDEARIARFLSSRGFAMSDSLRALKAARSDLQS